MAVERYFDGTNWVRVNKKTVMCGQSGGGYIALEDEPLYPSIVSSGYVDAIGGVSTITSTTPGNFLLAFLVSRSDDPIINAPGWTVWGGFAPIRRTTTATQRIWVLTKISTGSDLIQYNVDGAPGNYIIYYEFDSSEINLQSPIYIGPAPVIEQAGTQIRLSKSVNKLIIWVGHSCFFATNTTPNIWGTTSGLPLIHGADVVWSQDHPNILGSLADTTKIIDWSASGDLNSAGTANIRFIHATGSIYSVLPIAINHS